MAGFSLVLQLAVSQWNNPKVLDNADLVSACKHIAVADKRRHGGPSLLFLSSNHASVFLGMLFCSPISINRSSQRWLRGGKSCMSVLCMLLPCHAYRPRTIAFVRLQMDCGGWDWMRRPPRADRGVRTPGWYAVVGAWAESRSCWFDMKMYVENYQLSVTFDGDDFATTGNFTPAYRVSQAFNTALLREIGVSRLGVFESWRRHCMRYISQMRTELSLTVLYCRQILQCERQGQRGINLTSRGRMTWQWILIGELNLRLFTLLQIVPALPYIM